MAGYQYHATLPLQLRGHTCVYRSLCQEVGLFEDFRSTVSLVRCLWTDHLFLAVNRNLSPVWIICLIWVLKPKRLLDPFCTFVVYDLTLFPLLSQCVCSWQPNLSRKEQTRSAGTTSAVASRLYGEEGDGRTFEPVLVLYSYDLCIVRFLQAVLLAHCCLNPVHRNKSSR